MINREEITNIIKMVHRKRGNVNWKKLLKQKY